MDLIECSSPIRRKKIDLSELGWHWPVLENHQNEKAPEIPNWDGGQNICSSLKKEPNKRRLVNFINAHLAVDKLFPVNPRAIMGPPNMSVMLEVTIMCASIDHQTKAYPCYAHGWSYITSNQQGLMLLLNYRQHDCQQIICFARAPQTVV